jgi:UDP-glucose 4-epimerase
MKVLVTGGAGFIGSNLVEAYLNKGYEVVVVDNLTTGNMQHLASLKNITFYESGIETPEFLEIVKKEKPDVINHHAAQIDVQTSIHNPMEDASINIVGTINVLQACRENPAIKLVYASSAAVYGTPEYLGIDEKHPVKPISNYGISKHTPEHYIEVFHDIYGIDYTILRYANVYGKHQDPKGEGGVISILVDCAIENKTFSIFGDGEQTRDFVHIQDIVEANMLASEKAQNDIFNIGTAIPTSLNDTIVTFEKIVGFELDKVTMEERKGDIKHNYLSNDKAERKLGWQPKVSLEEGLSLTYEFYKQK